MIDKIRQEMSAVTHIQPCGRNARAISPWNLTTKWHKHISHFQSVELQRLIAMPKDEEFPGLVQVVRAYFSKATDLIEHMYELVLQQLNSPNPTKEWVALIYIRRCLIYIYILQRY
jgi:hypothetical protein